ncbi:MAG: hypothetical protein LBJ16_04295 [Holosporaceae bacterium]|jgi:type IV secretory pathway VirB10-like protein|nr:hypothetical protein [Holosporaceae bacterium]
MSKNIERMGTVLSLAILVFTFHSTVAESDSEKKTKLEECACVKEYMALLKTEEKAKKDDTKEEEKKEEEKKTETSPSDSSKVKALSSADLRKLKRENMQEALANTEKEEKDRLAQEKKEEEEREKAKEEERKEEEKKAFEEEMKKKEEAENEKKSSSSSSDSKEKDEKEKEKDEKDEKEEKDKEKDDKENGKTVAAFGVIPSTLLARADSGEERMGGRRELLSEKRTIRSYKVNRGDFEKFRKELERYRRVFA